MTRARKAIVDGFNLALGIFTACLGLILLGAMCGLMIRACKLVSGT
jgi:hypothetical protein